MSLIDFFKRRFECLMVYIRTREKCDTPPGLYLDPLNPNNWEIGPIIDGVNESYNMPRKPLPHPLGWYAPLPYPNKEAGHAHYFRIPCGSLKAYKKLILELEVQADPGVEFHPTNFPDVAATISGYFQRKGLKWTASFETYRWYAQFAVRKLEAGSITLELPLDGNWSAVMTSTRDNNPEALQEALEKAGMLGFVLGGGDGAGHGAYATGPARLIFKGCRLE